MDTISETNSGGMLARAGMQLSKPQSLVERFAGRFHVEAGKLLNTLKATAFKQPADKQTGRAPEVSNEQMMALLVVADQYNLNPFTREIYAFADPKRGGIVPIVGVDGWSRIINEHPEFDGMTFATAFQSDKVGKPESVTCTMYRRDRKHPIEITEYYRECRRDTGPWDSHPARMLRHKAMIQCARLAFGFVGIYDEDEGQRIIEGEHTTTSEPAIDELNASVKPPIDVETGEITTPDNIIPPGNRDKEAEEKRGRAESEKMQAPAADLMPAPTLAETLKAIAAADDIESLALVLDLARSLTVGDPQAAAEIDVAGRAKRKALGP